MTAGNAKTAEPSLSHLVVPERLFAQTPLVTADGETITAEDRFALMDLIHRFEWCVGSRHKEAFTTLFADDAVFDHAVGYARGKQEAVDLAWTVPSYGLRHLFANHVPFIDEQGRLCMISHILVIQAVSEQPVSVPFPAILDQGITRWVFQKQNGVWKFAEIVFEQHKLAAFVGAPESLYRAMAQTPAQRAADRATAS